MYFYDSRAWSTVTQELDQIVGSEPTCGAAFVPCDLPDKLSEVALGSAGAPECWLQLHADDALVEFRALEQVSTAELSVRVDISFRLCDPVQPACEPFPGTIS